MLGVKVRKEKVPSRRWILRDQSVQLWVWGFLIAASYQEFSQIPGLGEGGQGQKFHPEDNLGAVLLQLSCPAS